MGLRWKNGLISTAGLVIGKLRFEKWHLASIYKD